jgi:hypothetical protein
LSNKYTFIATYKIQGILDDLNLFLAILYIGPVVGNLYGHSGHIHKLKIVCRPEKNKNFIFLNYLKKYCLEL